MDSNIIFVLNETEEKVYKEKVIKNIAEEVVDIQVEVVMDKETFIECYKRWIKGEIK